MNTITATAGKPIYSLAAKSAIETQVDALAAKLAKLAPELRAARKRAAESEAELEAMQQARANAALSLSRIYGAYNLSQRGL